ncbi:MAG: Eco57I restriction-modification methylase domain-containing protein [Bacteroidales bacterium]|nr:Eco57I restriction-modification methylase domain-containing protein [Bacteroidales bacterium]
MINKTQIQPYDEIQRRIYAYTLPQVTDHNGYIKIGEAKTDVNQRIRQQTGTIGLTYELLFERLAIRKDNNKSFRDYDLHRFLLQQGIERGNFNQQAREWFFFNGTPNRAAELTDQFIANGYNTQEQTDYVLRKEQEEAVKVTKEYFVQNQQSEFLWNAKPRFGKTLTAYHLIREMCLQKVLIVTNRPAIANSWYDDYYKFIEHQTDYKFISDNDSLKGKALTRESFLKFARHSQITFLSLQDLKGSKHFGGDYDKLRWIKDLKWDLLIIDEAHEGVDTAKTDKAFDNINRCYTLHLSGTPFKALANEKFQTTQIFNWTYEDEQQAKQDWDYSFGINNPYENLPQLNLFTYKLSEMITEDLSKGIDINGENHEYAFDLNDFFEVKDRGFVHKDEVIKFLDNLTRGKFPFNEEQRAELRHTFWLLPGVQACKALQALLNKHPLFKDYEIVLAAGDGQSFEEESANIKSNLTSFNKVKTAIKSNNKTITLSCGQLTTGITIPEWTAVMMLSNIKSPALYFQAAFRSQNPYEYRQGDNIIRKERAYIFDFAPERTLKLYETFATNLTKHTSEREEQIRQLLNFFPVIAEDENGKMIELNAKEVLALPQQIKAMAVVKSGFMNNFLFVNVSRIFSAPNFVKEILNKLPSEKQKRLKYGAEIRINDYEKDEEGNPTANEQIVINTTNGILGEKIFETTNGNNAMQEAEQFINECAPAIKDTLNVTQKETDNIIHKIANKIKDGIEEIEQKYETAEQKNKTKEYLNEINDAVNETAFEELKAVIEKIEEKKEGSKKKQTEDDVRDKLRGFSRTIPSFLMAYGNKETTLDNFEKNIPDNIFLELTTLTIEEFKLLRDGGDYEEEGQKKHFEGRLFNEIVFNQAIKEFLSLKNKLSGYFNSSQTENIFDYIPPQQTNQIFTPKKVVRQMIDALEQHIPNLFENDQLVFADLYMKSGLYLIEIVKRLFKGLANKIPDEQQRLQHIFSKQIVGAVPNDILRRITLESISGGNERLKQIIESRIYEADIVNKNQRGQLRNMKFDVIIGNPPYQQADGGAGASAIPIYNKFIEQAKQLTPKYICLIIPSRWQIGGKGLDSFRQDMITDRRIKFMADYVNGKEIFPDNDVKGGICYFLWDKDYDDVCEIETHVDNEVLKSKRLLKNDFSDTYIRFDVQLSVLQKISKKNEKKISEITSERKLYGFSSDVISDPSKYDLPPFSDKSIKNGYTLIGLLQNKRVERYISKNYPIRVNKDKINQWKIFVPKAYGCGSTGETIPTPILGSPIHLCTETFLQIGGFETKQEAENLLSYIKTRFFRFCVGILKTTQNTSQNTYSLVPMQDFKEQWTDEKLYKKYKLTKDEITFIETMIKPME